MVELEKRISRRDLIRFISPLLITLSLPKSSLAYKIVESELKYRNGVQYPFDPLDLINELSTHPLITLSAINILSYDNVKLEAEEYMGELAGGTIDEDIPFGKSFSHFLGPLTRIGITHTNIASALTRAESKFKSATEDYEKKNKGEAYKDLGSVLHLIQDMHAPEHVFLKQHAFPKSPFEKAAKEYYDPLLRHFILTHQTSLKIERPIIYDKIESYILGSSLFTFNEYKIRFKETNISDLTEEQIVNFLNILIPNAISISAGLIEFFYSYANKN